MTKPLLCKVMIGRTGLEFESAITDGKTLSETIDQDKKYGKMVPANGKYFTWVVLNEDQEFTLREMQKAVGFAQRRWRIYGNMARFRLVKKDYQGIIDFRIEFRTVETDPDKELTENTVMYHYYPISDVNHPLRGLCVINKKFFFTSHGEFVDGSFLVSKGFEVQYLDGRYETLDADAIYGHELGHGLGLNHDDLPFNMMAYRVDIMAEYPSVRDQSRIKAKYGHRWMSAWVLMRWLKWLKGASERG